MARPGWGRRVGYRGGGAGGWADRVAAQCPCGDAGGGSVDETVAALLDALGLPLVLLEQSVATASTGERQRLALIRVLLLNRVLKPLEEPGVAVVVVVGLHALNLAGVGVADARQLPALGLGSLGLVVPAQVQARTADKSVVGLFGAGERHRATGTR